MMMLSPATMAIMTMVEIYRVLKVSFFSSLGLVNARYKQRIMNSVRNSSLIKKLALKILFWKTLVLKIPLRVIMKKINWIQKTKNT